MKTRSDRAKNFIDLSKIIHTNKYDYSKVNYINNRINVKIICPIHGEFLKRPYCHIKRKMGCTKCSRKNFSNRCKSNTTEFLKKADQIHGDIYDYSLVKYKNSKTKIIIICKKHGIFSQRPNDHLNGQKCKRCSMENASRILKNRIISNETRKKMRLSRIRYINKCVNQQIYPTYNPKACRFIENYGRRHGYKFQHAMNGGEFFIKDLGYWVDGYDKKKNVVFEYDEKHHFDRTTGKLKPKDVHRMNEIKQHLGCKFIRYNEKKHSIVEI